MYLGEGGDPNIGLWPHFGIAIDRVQACDLKHASIDMHHVHVVPDGHIMYPSFELYLFLPGTLKCGERVILMGHSFFSAIEYEFIHSFALFFD